MSNRKVLVFHCSASSWSLDTARFRSEPAAAEIAPRLAPGPSLLLALLLSLGLGRNLVGSILCDFSVPFVAKGVCGEPRAGYLGGRVLLANGSLARFYWHVVDDLVYWLTQAMLWFVDAVSEPEPEAHRQRAPRELI
jgi:hypothetical protein